ncbi:unnamed protein product [Psylliodes chrysocephalus]|uniref:Tetraspanin n=1 Tax=Psylliodes chrysocephalus TaxID=3402493 RepID=A0A9P0G632_9CUCU|nr:unnamed protein product [Psylliodes chrysocephala]
MVSLRCKKAFCVGYSGLLFGSGILLIVLSSILLYRIFHHFDFIPGSTTGPLILLIILGILHLLLTWLGVKGPTREHNFHIILFMFFTFILLIGEFTIGVWSMVLWDSVAVPSTDLMTQSFNEIMKEQVYSKSWSKVQAEVQCCGLHGPQDYINFEEEGAMKLSFLSCKNNEVSNPGGQVVPYEEGCEEMFVKYVELILIESAIMGFLSAIFQGLGLFVVFSFFRTLREARAKRSARRAELQRQLSGQSQHSEVLLPPPVNMGPSMQSPPGSAAPPTSASVPLQTDGASAPPPYNHSETEKV